MKTSDEIEGLMCFINFIKYRGPGQCKLYLSVELILTIPDRWKSFKQAWQTTLHEMCVSLTKHDRTLVSS